MDMSLEPNTLASLCELTGDAMIGAEGRRLLFVSPAARELLGAAPDAELTELLPEEIISEPSERFAAGLRLGERDFTVSVSREPGENGSSLYLLRPQEEPETARADALQIAAGLGSLLMTQRIAIDRLLQTESARSEPETAELASYLCHSYYRAKRLQNHIAIASLPERSHRFRSRSLILLDELFGAVCDTTRALTENSGVTIRFETEGRCLVLGYARDLEILLFNLLANSLQHTRPGDEIRVRVSERGGMCVLSVDDNGTGIRPARFGSLFTGAQEPDLTDPAAGPGYGMRIVRSIAGDHCGTVMVDSPKDGGTHIRVTFKKPEPNSADLREPDAYTPAGMDLALTELSVVLDRSKYTERYLD